MDKVFTLPDEQTTQAEISMQRKTAVGPATSSCAGFLLVSMWQDPKKCGCHHPYLLQMANTMTAQLMMSINQIFLLSTVMCKHIQTIWSSSNKFKDKFWDKITWLHLKFPTKFMLYFYKSFCRWFIFSYFLIAFHTCATYLQVQIITCTKECGWYYSNY